MIATGLANKMISQKCNIGTASWLIKQYRATLHVKVLLLIFFQEKPAALFSLLCRLVYQDQKHFRKDTELEAFLSCNKLSGKLVFANFLDELRGKKIIRSPSSSEEFFGL